MTPEPIPREVTCESTQNSPDFKSSSAPADPKDTSQASSYLKDSIGGKVDGDVDGKRRDVKSDQKRARSGNQGSHEGGSEEGGLQQLLGEEGGDGGSVCSGGWRVEGHLPAAQDGSEWWVEGLCTGPGAGCRQCCGAGSGWGMMGMKRGFGMDQELDAGDAVVFEKVDSLTLKELDAGNALVFEKMDRDTLKVHIPVQCSEAVYMCG
ncbi:unnamed protein product [Closterium sp. Naga37s-1]|nr:unnamed protein product [Closterium sp. Naga37s-1]